ncbi:carboxymuconolactone decarboxylase family protein [Bernardetia sp. ABR2-2B]|uniref:carboxymuconolactone decarboxylase family protein n=1 Tax=Bernardetia sp. ABR2-2B TaxID=3127472 RepID=UPI0030D4A11B
MATPNFNVPTRNEVDTTAQQIFDGVKKSLGTVPNLYAYMGHSSNALSAAMALGQAQAKSTFSNKEKEAVFLAVSQLNGCNYCLAAHTALGKMNGFTEEETIQLRQGTHSDKKLTLISTLAAEIQRTHGRPSQELLNQFFEAGYDQKALVDLVLLVSDKVFSNYLHNITQIPVDFPAAKPLETELA